MAKGAREISVGPHRVGAIAWHIEDDSENVGQRWLLKNQRRKDVRASRRQNRKQLKLKFDSLVPKPLDGMRPKGVVKTLVDLLLEASGATADKVRHGCLRITAGFLLL